MSSVTKDHAVDRFIFGTRLTHLLHALIAVLDKFNASLSQCGVEVRTYHCLSSSNYIQGD